MDLPSRIGRDPFAGFSPRGLGTSALAFLSRADRAVCFGSIQKRSAKLPSPKGRPEIPSMAPI
jgi:hypothetical protein